MQKKKRGKRGEGCVYRINKESGNWYIKYYLNGKPNYENSGSTERSIAEKILRDRLAKKLLGQLVPGAARVTFEHMEEDILNDYKINGKKSLDRVKLSIANLREYFAGNRAESITTDRIKAYVRERQTEGAANASINRDLSSLRRMFNLSIQANKLSRRPHMPMLRENNVRTGFFEANEFLTLRVALPPELRPVVTFAYYTGWRKGEILDLRWSQVDLQERIIRLNPEQAKNGNGRIVALDGELLAVLQAQWEARKVSRLSDGSLTLICPFVFHRRGKAISDFRSAWEKALAEAKLTGKLFHDLRRTAVRNMVRAGVPERVAMTISGHKTRSVFDRYNIVSEEDVREAARKTSERIHSQVVPITQANKSKS